jgi:hypothetical protein
LNYKKNIKETIQCIKINHNLQNIHNHQTPSFNSDGFMSNPTAPLNPPLTSAYPNPALQSTTAEASALAAQLIDQLKEANETADAVQSKQQVSFEKTKNIYKKL